MKTEEFYNKEGQIKNSLIAEDMAYIEKPYRETPLSMWKRFISSKANEILIGERKAETFLEDTGSEEIFLERRKIEEEKKARRQKAIDLLNNEYDFKSFLKKIDIDDIYFGKGYGYEMLRGNIDGLKIEIDYESKRKFWYRSDIDGKAVYNYYWEYTGHIDGMYMNSTKSGMIMDGYKKKQKEANNTIRGNCISSSDLKILKLIREGNYSLQKFQKADRCFKLIGTIGTHNVSIEGFSKKIYTENIYCGENGYTRSYIDGNEISDELSSHIWGLTNNQK